MKKVSILLVDDDEGILETMSAILEEKGYHIDTANNGKDAIEKTKKNFYNVALLDIKLPDIEGTKLLTELRETTPKMIKIMITGYAALENAVEALNKGADSYIMKPVDIENLLAIINEKLKAQKETEKMSQEKVTEWIETRARKLAKGRL
jgi:DNA-binding NtrC family response regulator